MMSWFLTYLQLLLLLVVVGFGGCHAMADPDVEAFHEQGQNSKFLRTASSTSDMLLYYQDNNRDLLGLSYKGSNPTSKLGRCEGDCDNNNDCEGNLICFDRDAGDTRPVPGCTGTDTSRTDYCVDPDDVNEPPSGSPPTSNPPPTSPPNPSPTNPPNPPPTSPPNPPPPTPNSGSTSLHSYGSNPPPSRFPLGLCEGDCDDDNDCEGSLECYQRGANAGRVPGCSGRDDSRTDYCVDMDGGGGNPPTPSPPPPSPPPPTPPTPTPPSSTPSDLEDFKLKLYWERGYYWQEERRERKWCMRCRGGSCDSGDKLYIERCDSSGVQKFDFEYVNDDEVLIKIHGRSRCLERSGNDIKVRRCDSGDSKQRWFAKRGDFDEDKFEISQDGASSKCITQRHHPKAGEVVELEPCTTARDGDTSYWERCYSRNC